MTGRRHLPLYIFFALFLLCQSAVALGLQGTQARWSNVPPVPGKGSSALFALGDRQLAYRTTGLMLQTLGDNGGKSMPLADYDYERLGEWFRLADGLDPVSNFMPVLAAYYFGATPDVADLTPVIDYLAMIGQRPEEQKWRWLAQAVYLARFQQGDMNKAYELSTTLAGLWQEGRPAWMRQMPVLVMNARGDREAAYSMMLSILKEDADRMNPAEVNSMMAYICEQILDTAQAAQNPLCTSRP